MADVKVINGRYHAMIDGRLIKRANKAQMRHELKKAGIEWNEDSVDVVESQPELTQCEFSVIERYDFIVKFVQLVAMREISSFLLCGSGGIGKTTTVLNTLKSFGLTENTPEHTDGDFVVIRGFSTPRALYETLYHFRDKIVVLDDADQVFTNAVGANLLKAALDDKEERIIDWNTTKTDSDIPSRFTYTGQMIFISNMPIAKFPQALLSRSHKVDLTLTNIEKVDIIEEVFKKIDHDTQQKRDVLNFVRMNAHRARDLNIRSAVSLLVLRDNFGDNWERIVEYSFCN